MAVCSHLAFSVDVEAAGAVPTWPIVTCSVRISDYATECRRRSDEHCDGRPRRFDTKEARNRVLRLLNQTCRPVVRPLHNNLTDLAWRDRHFVSCLQGVSTVPCITSA